MLFQFNLIKALLISQCVVIENMKSENRKLAQKVRSVRYIHTDQVYID